MNYYYNTLSTIYEDDIINNIVIPKQLNYKRPIFYDLNIIKNTKINNFKIYYNNDKYITFLSKPYTIYNLLHFIIKYINIILTKKLEVVFDDNNLEVYHIFNNDYTIQNIKYICNSISIFIKKQTNITLNINIIINHKYNHNCIIFDTYKS